MQHTKTFLIFVITLKFQGSNPCASQQISPIPISPKPITQCPDWVREGPVNLKTVRISEVAAKAFLIHKKDYKLDSEATFDNLTATITNIPAMKSAMNEKGSMKEINSSVFTILKFLNTSQELRNHSSEFLGFHIQEVFNGNASFQDRVQNAKLALPALQQMLNTFNETTSVFAQTKGASAPYLLSLATIFAAVGRLIVRHERTACYTDSSGSNQIAGATNATGAREGDNISQIEKNFKDLKVLLKEYREQGLSERLDLIKSEPRTDCMYVYERWKVEEDGTCELKRADAETADEFLGACVYPSIEDSAAIPKNFDPIPGFLDSGTGKYVCELMANCRGQYISQLESSYLAHYEAVISRLYLSKKTQVQSKSWNELLRTDIFTGRPKEPNCNKNATLEELQNVLEDSTVYSNYRTSFKKPELGPEQLLPSLKVFSRSVLAIAERNLDYEAGLSSLSARINRFTHKEPA